MVIQEIDFREKKEQELWDRRKGTLWIQDEKLIFDKNTVFSTDTYYNSFSVGKWKEYCDIKEIALEFTFYGAFLVRLYHAVVSERNQLKKKEIQRKTIQTEKETKVSFAIHPTDGVVYVQIEALEANSYVKQMAYVGACEKEREVTIALNICTFQREKFLSKNIRVLEKGLLENKELQEHIKVFIVDNGKTLNQKQYRSQNIFLYPNENVGGAGGFTRGLVEILKKKETESITHVIFMDDDIEFEIETIKRTYVFLCTLKETYQNAFLAGAMLRLDQPYIQNENGAWWNYGGVILRNSNLDLRDFKNVVKNEQFETVDYAAWFYCCMPIEIVTKQNLPLPLFLHGDDVEYGLRNAKQILTMNGIAVAHPVVAHKCVSANSYYDLRNALIVNACHCNQSYTKKAAKKRVIKDLLQAFLTYRYKDMHLIYLALEDFCKGPEWLYRVDGVSYHKKLQKMGYRFQKVTETVKERENMAKAHEHTLGYLETFKQATSWKERLLVLVQILSFNGWLLPAKEEVGVFYMNVRPIHFYRRKRVILYDEITMEGILVEKSYRQLFVFLKLVIKTCYLIDKKFAKSKDAYYNTSDKLRSITYWNEKYQYEDK